MSDEQSPPPPATPVGNQNLIIGLVLGAVVLLLFLLVMQVKTNGGGSGKTSEFDALKLEVGAARNRVNEERRLLGLPALGTGANGQSIESLAARISGDATTLTGLATQLQSLLSEKESLLGSADATRKALTQQITDLQRQLDQARLAAGETNILQGKLLETQTLLEAANRQIAAFSEQLAGSPSATEMASLNVRLENALADRERFETMVKDLNNQLVGKVDGTQLDALQSRVAFLEPENNKLRYEIQELRKKLNKTLLFVEKVDDLPAAAKALYIELSKLETASPAELKQAYERIDRDLHAKVADQISFPTGSSRVNLDKVDEIRRSHQAAGEGSIYLIVGYASKTGSIDKNRVLSSDRATTLASVAHQNKKGEQIVRAVYLGQTDRFSPGDPLKNQICEIWEIREQ
jgi:predicted  nucleic acid-binding Zn-ribbon protein